MKKTPVLKILIIIVVVFLAFKLIIVAVEKHSMSGESQPQSARAERVN